MSELPGSLPPLRPGELSINFRIGKITLSVINVAGSTVARRVVTSLAERPSPRCAKMRGDEYAAHSAVPARSGGLRSMEKGMHTLRLTREPGWDGSRLILFRLMSRISRDGIMVSYKAGPQRARMIAQKRDIRRRGIRRSCCSSKRDSEDAIAGRTPWVEW